MAHLRKFIRIKAAVDTRTNRVVFAESEGDFVDHLVSFMTLPVGTITRLVSNDSPTIFSRMKTLYSGPRLQKVHHNQSNVFRCLTNLYNSVQNLEAHHLKSEVCKRILLFPKRPYESACLNLNLKMNNMEPTEYSWCSVHPKKLSYGRQLSCNCNVHNSNCGILEQVKIELPGHDGTVFVKNGRYVISEGMHIHKGSMGTCRSLLDIHGISRLDRLEEREVDMGVKEVLLLLKCSLFSNTPLTDVILQKGRPDPAITNKIKGITGQHPSMGTREISTEDNTKTSVTVVVRKSTEEVLYVKANEDFVDFLFSFLTLPLGSVIKLCGGSSSLGCFDNMYNSIGDVISEEWKEKFDHVLVAPHHGCGESQLLCVEEDHPIVDGGTMPRKITNPKSANRYDTSSGGGYIKGPSTFKVTNDLVVTPISSTSELFHLKKLKIPIYDIEEHVVPIGKEEALDLLKASLVSNEALSLFQVTKTTKVQIKKKVLH